MDKKYFKSCIIIALFSLLTACGGNSKSSGEMNIASCNIGNNALSEGGSCMVEANSTAYVCKKGIVTASTPQKRPHDVEDKDVITGTGSPNKLRGEVLEISTDSDKPRYQRSADAKATIYCASNPPS